MAKYGIKDKWLRNTGARLRCLQGVLLHSDLVDANGITTNDVAAMLRTYGVEVGCDVFGP